MAQMVVGQRAEWIPSGSLTPAAQSQERALPHRRSESKVVFGEATSAVTILAQRTEPEEHWPPRKWDDHARFGVGHWLPTAGPLRGPQNAASYAGAVNRAPPTSERAARRRAQVPGVLLGPGTQTTQTWTGSSPP